MVQSYVVEADKKFRQNELRDAYFLYKSILNNFRLTSKMHLRLSTSLIVTKMLYERIWTDQDFFSGENNDEFVDFLKQKMQFDYEYDYSDELISDLNQINLKELISCFRASPFQTSLICTVIFAIHKLHGNPIKLLEKIIAEQSTDNHNITYANYLFHLLKDDNLTVSEIEPLLPQTESIKLESFNIFAKEFIAAFQNQLSSIRTIGDLYESLELTLDSNYKYALNFRTTNKPANKFAATVYAGSIYLNEQQFIYKCLAHHYPLVDQWCLVEGACLGYPKRKVTKDGLSSDLSSLKLLLFPDSYRKLIYKRHGWTNSFGEDAKSELRNKYLDDFFGDILMVIDIDEFHPSNSFFKSVELLMSSDEYSCVRMPNIHFWKNTKSFIVGGYYDIIHHRYFRIKSKVRYKQNHNFPEDYSGQMLNHSVARFKKNISYAGENAIWTDYYIYHMGFAKSEDNMNDKTKYYVNRGETSYRPKTTSSRAAWFDDRKLPEECKIYPFNQCLIKVLQDI